MKKMYACWIFLISVLFVAILYFGYAFIDSISGYQELEADMVEAADAYLLINKMSLSVGESLVLDSKQLLDAQTLSRMEVEKDKCLGYVRVKKNISGYDFKAFIKCDDYVTEGYDD